jgi:hypothetical protein
MEEKVGALGSQIEANHAEMKEIFREVMAGQKAGADDRAAIKEQLSKAVTDIRAMKPHMETVATAKNLWKAFAVLVAMATGVAAAVASAWPYVKSYILWAVGKH